MKFLLLLFASLLLAQESELILVEPVNSLPGKIVFRSTGADASPVTNINDIMVYNKNNLLFCKNINSLDCFNITAPTVAFASLGSPTNGTMYYCPTCQQTNPCVAGGSGAIARRENSAWNCGGGGGGGGITSLGGQTGSTQTFANVNDTNIGIAVGSAANTHTLTASWIGTLAKARMVGTTVHTDQGNTFSTGNQDMAAVTSFTMPIGVAAAPTANGRIAYNSTSNTVVVGVNGATKTLALTDGVITSLGGQTGATQTFSKADDTNITLTITSATNNHGFALGWTGTLAKARQHSTTVYNDAANTFTTGIQDFSAVTALVMPSSAGAAPTSNGRIAYDTTANAVKLGVNGSSLRVLTATDGTQQSAVVLPELTVNGTNVFVLAGAPSQSADVCVEVNGSQPAGSGYYLVTTGNSASRTIDGASVTCRETQWTQITNATEVSYPAANCQNTTASTGFDLATTNTPTAACVTGTNTQYGVLQFDAGTDESVQTALDLPSTWTGAIDIVFKWRAAATTGDVVWAAQTVCVAPGETGDPAFNSASTVTDTVQGTTLQFNTASIAGITTTGCAPSERMFLKFYRDADAGGDTMSGDADLISVVLTIRKTL